MQNVKKGDFVKLGGVTYRVASRRGDGVLELADYWGKFVDVLPESDARLSPGKKEDMVANSARCNSTNPVVQNAINARTARNSVVIATNTMGDGASDASSQIDGIINELKYILGFKLNRNAAESSQNAYKEVVSIVKPLIVTLKKAKADIDRARKIADRQGL